MFGKVEKFPMTNGQVMKTNPSSIYACRGNPGLFIYSSHDSVFSLSQVKVCAVFDIGDEIGIVTRDDCGTFYAYTNLGSCFAEKGNHLQKGAFMGQAKFDDDKKLFKLLLMVVADNQYISEENIWKLIKGSNEQILQFQ